MSYQILQFVQMVSIRSSSPTEQQRIGQKEMVKALIVKFNTFVEAKSLFILPNSPSSLPHVFLYIHRDGKPSRVLDFRYHGTSVELLWRLNFMAVTSPCPDFVSLWRNWEKLLWTIPLLRWFLTFLVFLHHTYPMAHGFWVCDFIWGTLLKFKGLQEFPRIKVEMIKFNLV